MARENQGLQIALIIFVTTTVILGAMTWFVFQNYKDSAGKVKTLTDDNSAKQSSIDELTRERDFMKQLIAGPALGDSTTALTNTLKGQYDDDMENFGKGYSAEWKFYHPLVEKLAQSLQQKDMELKMTKEKLQDLEVRFLQREAGKDAQIETFDKEVKKVTADLVAVTEKFQKQYEEISQEKATLASRVQTVRKDLESDLAKVKEKAEGLSKSLAEALTTIKHQGKKIEDITNTVVSAPDGEVRWVDQKNGLVWINLGRGDDLKPLQTFAVYSADISDLTQGKPKASIEVTQLRGDHVAEARITRDIIAEPILPGDKIHTPLWQPGDKMHFALAGVMDVDGDGKSDLDLVRSLISLNNGVVDAYQEDQGKEIGKIDGRMSLATRYLVLGEEPKEKTAPQITEERTKMITRAGELGIRSMTLKDLLDRMGYRRQARVVTYGPGADSQDFIIRHGNGPPRVSSGNVSDVFKPRQPPRGKAGGAY
ncbi:MAG: hypothetical protein JXB10_03775 [Pirellulales bacterium]|nr:hypothetical protein [Pirellulales bacterium]